MKVLLISHGFPPVVHSGTFRSEAFARYLPEFGIQPVVLAGSDGYKVLEYTNGVQESVPPPCEIVRIPWFANSGQSVSPFLKVLRRFPIGWTLGRVWEQIQIDRRVLPTALKLVADHDPQAIFATAPPWNALPLARKLARQTSLPYVCDLRDPWTYYSYATYRHWVDFLSARYTERSVLSSARCVLANTPTAKRMLVEKIQVPARQVLVLPNGYDESQFQTVKSRANGPLSPGKFVIAYTGLLSSRAPMRTGLKETWKRCLGLDYRPVRSDPETRSPFWFLAALRSLLEQRPELRQVLETWFVGAFSAADERHFAEFSFPECIRVTPPVNAPEAISIACRADLLLLLQIEMRLDDVDFCTAVPGKLFAYLRTGTPILAPMQSSDGTRLIEQFQAGVVVAPRDVQGIARAIESAVDRWHAGNWLGKREIASELVRYERRSLTKQLAEILFHVTEQRRGFRAPFLEDARRCGVTDGQSDEFYFSSWD